MAREEMAIFTTLCMVTDPDGNILVEDRVDPGWKGLSLPGGHVENGESFTRAAVREVWEETGLTILDPVLCGVKQFSTDSGARYVVFLYRATRFHGTLTSSDEGSVFWVSRGDMHRYPQTPHLEEILRVMENPKLSEFIYEQSEGEWLARLL